MIFQSKAVQNLIKLALEEDCVWNDVTSNLCVPKQKKGNALIIAKQSLVVCGLPLIAEIARSYGAKLKIKIIVEEGQAVKGGQPLVRISGSMRDLLALERSILNFTQRLSGIATLARELKKIAGSKLTVLDTRKTTPGWRVLEKYAVFVGGASNHRFSLADMILVKNNHIDANGGDIRRTLSLIVKHKPTNMRMEVEVRDLKELAIALDFSPDVIMLDNFCNSQISVALKVVSKSICHPIIEVSGGVSAKRLTELRRLGVSFVSVGALTTQAQNVDISMRIAVIK